MSKIKFSRLIKFMFITQLFITNFGWGQTTIKGSVTDEKNQPIPNTSVILSSENQQKIVEYCYSDFNGNYELKATIIGKFNIAFASLSFKTTVISVEITNESTVIEKNAVLIFQPLELNEVIIRKEGPIQIKKDTIIFDVKAFSNGNERVVEDLLKKIPGITISSTGVIKIGKQEVEKVMVDGDDFFEKGYSVLTKNMPSSPLEKVELYEHYSNNKHLKGIETSNKIALNLKLKSNAKRQWFGNVLLGYGLISKNRYEVRSNLMNFGKKSKHYYLTNLNNIGNDPVGDINNLIRPFKPDNTSSIGDDQSAKSLLSLGNYSPNLKPRRVNFNNNEMLSLNTIYSLSPKIKIKALGFFNTDENDFYSNTVYTYSIGSTQFQNVEEFNGRNKNYTSFGKIDFSYDISKTETLEYSGKLNATYENNKSDITFNSNLLNEKVISNNQLLDQKIEYTNRFSSQKVLIVTGRYINEKTPQNYFVNQLAFPNLFSAKANNTSQFSKNEMQFAGFESHFLNKKKNDDLLEVQFGNQFRKDNLISYFQLKENDVVIDTPSNYNNNLSYISNDLYLNIKYEFYLNKFSLQTQVGFNQILNQWERLEEAKKQNPFFIKPVLGCIWRISKRKDLIISFSLNRTNATILEVYDNYIQTGFRSFSKGTGNFNQLEAFVSSLDYRYEGKNRDFLFDTSIQFSKDNDFFGTKYIESPTYSLSESIVINNRAFLTVSNTMDYYLRFFESNLKLKLNGTSSSYENIVNDSNFITIKSNSFNYGFEFRSAFRGFFNYHFGSNWEQREIKTAQTNSIINNTSFLDLLFTISSKLNLKTQLEHYSFGNLNSKNNTFDFMDLEAQYLVNDKLTFSFTGQNLFNTKTFKSSYVNDISSYETIYKLQPRYAILKMEFKF